MHTLTNHQINQTSIFQDFFRIFQSEHFFFFQERKKNSTQYRKCGIPHLHAVITSQNYPGHE